MYSSHSSFFFLLIPDSTGPCSQTAEFTKSMSTVYRKLFSFVCSTTVVVVFTSLEPAELTLFKVLTLISTVRKCVMGLCARLGFPYTQILHTNNSDDE